MLFSTDTQNQLPVLKAQEKTPASKNPASNNTVQQRGESSDPSLSVPRAQDK
jgi:hypothetical protein